jgi:hypothetical protein
MAHFDVRDAATSCLKLGDERTQRGHCNSVAIDRPIATICCEMSVQRSTVCSTLGVGGTSDQSEWISAPFWIVRHRIPIRRYKNARPQRHFNLPSG